MHYKILTSTQWLTLQKTQFFQGSEHDLRDGFIHLALAEQVEKVISRYFSHEKKIYIVGLKIPDDFDLRLEKATNGEFFPHLYAHPIETKWISYIQVQSQY